MYCDPLFLPPPPCSSNATAGGGDHPAPNGPSTFSAPLSSVFRVRFIAGRQHRRHRIWFPSAPFSSLWAPPRQVHYVRSPTESPASRLIRPPVVFYVSKCFLKLFTFPKYIIFCLVVGLCITLKSSLVPVAAKSRPTHCRTNHQTSELFVETNGLCALN